MKHAAWLFLVLALMSNGDRLNAQRVVKIPVVEIKRGTIIAFYTPGPVPANVEKDSNETLSDFKLYAEHVNHPLSKIDIDFKVLYVRSFRLHLNGEGIVFRSKFDAVDYHLIAPGK